VFSWWPALIGFAAGFGTQLAVMLLNRGDYTDVVKATAQFHNRIDNLPIVLPDVVTGSAFVARYTGDEFSPLMIDRVVWIIGILVVLGLGLSVWQKKKSWLWAVGLAAHLYVLMYMVQQYSLRYFVVLGLGIWLLAGAGLAMGLKKVWSPLVNSGGLASVVAVGLLLFSVTNVLVPFLQTGGSLEEFGLGDRSDRAAALIDTGVLLECIKGQGPVYAADVHIHNRLRYMSYNGANDLQVVAQNESIERAEWVISYRYDEAVDEKFELCPELEHWKVIKRDRG